MFAQSSLGVDSTLSRYSLGKKGKKMGNVNDKQMINKRGCSGSVCTVVVLLSNLERMKRHNAIGNGGGRYRYAMVCVLLCRGEWRQLVRRCYFRRRKPMPKRSTAARSSSSRTDGSAMLMRALARSARGRLRR